MTSPTKIRMQRSELLTIFVTLLIAASCFLSVSFLIALLPSANKYHSPETKLEQRFLRAMQPHLMPFKTISPIPNDPEVADEKDRMEGCDRGIPKDEGTVDGKPWVQKPFPYQAKCLVWLREGYEALARSDRAVVDAFLAGTGCESLV